MPERKILLTSSDEPFHSEKRGVEPSRFYSTKIVGLCSRDIPGRNARRESTPWLPRVSSYFMENAGRL